jgi:hypothetical protein
MPYQTRKIRGKNCYRVTKKSGKNNRKSLNKNNKSFKNKTVFSKCTTKEKADKQLRLLRALQYNKNFVFRPKKVSSNK